MRTHHFRLCSGKIEVVQFLIYLLLELGVLPKCNGKAFYVMLSLLLGWYYSIVQNRNSACAGTPQTTVLLYWASSHCNSITRIFEKIITAPRKIFSMEGLLFCVLVWRCSVKFTFLLWISSLCEWCELKVRLWALIYTHQSHWWFH